jgi:glycosidase
MVNEGTWWKKAVFYQIYPRSFCDTTNNGIGDLQGIISKVKYLIDLGIDAVWLSPFYPSPQEDFGYDITDFKSINPEYGTMEDFNELLETFHENGIKIIIDMVLNHTSQHHPWFIESKSSTSNPKRDWYVWKKGRGANGRKIPNNWNAYVGGSAWGWDEGTREFYLHQFLPCQPDLNWRNPEVKQTMFEIMRFWLDKGVDGFRLDLIHTVYEDMKFRNNPRSRHLFPSYDYTDSLFQKPLYSRYQDETLELCIELRNLVQNYSPERVLVGEATGEPRIFHPLYGDGEKQGLHLIFDLHFANQPFSAQKFQNSIFKSVKTLDKLWPCYTFSNHDLVRMISRHGNNEYKARLLGLLLLTLRGTPFIYQGEEIGMQQGKISRSMVKDPIARLRFWGLPLGYFFGRDGCRTPMQWTDSLNAGFSPDPSTIPWLPVSSDLPIVNVDSQVEDRKSMLSFYKILLEVRRENKCLQSGQQQFFQVKNRNCLAFSRANENQKFIILLNFNKGKVIIAEDFSEAKRIFSTHFLNEQIPVSDSIDLKAFEGVIIEMKPSDASY